jgi:hypothetical protein
MSAENLIIGQGGNGVAPAAAADLIKDTTTKDFRTDVMEVSRSVPVLGAVVRSLQTADAGPREGREGGEGQGEAR